MPCESRSGASAVSLKLPPQLQLQPLLTQLLVDQDLRTLLLHVVSWGAAVPSSSWQPPRCHEVDFQSQNAAAAAPVVGMTAVANAVAAAGVVLG